MTLFILFSSHLLDKKTKCAVISKRCDVACWDIYDPGARSSVGMHNHSHSHGQVFPRQQAV
jgi:hypothetical protein